jgi:hypothetical protein
VETDRTLPNNKPDIIFRDNEKRTCLLIDIAILGDRNLIKKEAEKTKKIYESLTVGAAFARVISYFHQQVQQC